MNFDSDGTTSAYMRRTSFVTASQEYQLEYEITRNDGGTGVLRLDASGVIMILNTTVGTHVVQFIADGVDFTITKQTGVVTDVDLDNISLKELN